MRTTAFTLFLFAATLLLEGCATPNFKPMTSSPSGSAVVYLYREYSILGSGVSYKIFANGKPITLLSAAGIFVDNNYYPYVATPGKITFTGKQVSNGAMHLFDFMTPKVKLAQLNVEAGKTYYLKFKWKYVGVTYWPRLVLEDNEIGSREITNCVMDKSFESSLTRK